MKTLSGLFALIAMTSLQSHADIGCSFKAQQAAQIIGQSNGLTGNFVESPFSKGLQTVTIDKTQSYIVYAGGSDCVVNDILLNTNSLRAESTSAVACNMKIERLAQAIAQLNGLSGNLVESKYSTTNEFSVTVDKSQTYTLRVGIDGSCTVEQISLNH